MGGLYKTRRVDSCLPVYNAIQNNTMKNWFDLIPRNLMFLHWVDRVPEPLNQVEIGVVKMATTRFTIGCQIIFLMLCGRRKILVVFFQALCPLVFLSAKRNWRNLKLSRRRFPLTHYFPASFREVPGCQVLENTIFWGTLIVLVSSCSEESKLDK